jgi:hypothetical protein
VRLSYSETAQLRALNSTHSIFCNRRKMKIHKTFNNPFLVCALLGATIISSAFFDNPAWAAPKKPAPKKPAAKPKAPAKTNVPAIFYDEEWSYRTATLYDKKENIVTSVSGNAKFGRDGKYEQNYYIGNIGNFFKGKYTLNGDRLTTYDEKGEKVFDFKFTVGTDPKILVLTLFNDDGTKSMDFSLVPVEKKKK